MLATQTWRQRAVEKLAEYLEEKYTANLLSEEDLVRRDLFGDFEWAWSLVSDFGEGIPQLVVAVDGDYPGSFPKIVVCPSEHWYLRVPHVEKNGSVCALPTHASGDLSNPSGVLEEVLERAVLTLREGMSGCNRADFINEIESYWGSADSGKLGPIWFIGDPGLHPRLVCVAIGGRFTLVGDSEAQCANWLANYHGNAKVKFKARKGLYIPHHSGIYPEDFPATNADVIKLVAANHPEMIVKLASLATGTDDIAVFFGIPSANGTGMVAAFLKGRRTVKLYPGFPGHRPPRSPFPGFRPGRIPSNVFVRSLGKEPCVRRVVGRAFPTWIHSRGGAQGLEMIMNKNLVIIGCGSLGSEVAQMLCKAGVKRVKLIDHEILSMDNIGRHLLGARDAGINKAEALRKHLLGQFPHAEIVAVHRKWEHLVADDGEGEVFDADLVISLTGEWQSDCALNMEARSRSKPSVIFGWTEPHGQAGHALLVGPRGGCVACGRDTFGKVIDRVTDWPESPLKAVPACGGFYQPYGAVDTGPINSMIASLAISTLLERSLGSQLRTWLGNRAMIEGLGGVIASGWLPHFDDPTVMGKVVATPWPKRPSCPQCNQA